MRNNGNDIDVADTVWKEFCATGHIGSYLFYRRLVGENDGINDRSGNSDSK